MYCDTHPESVDVNSVATTENIDRWIKAEVLLSCALGYIGSNEKLIKVTCTEYEQTTGTWKTIDKCDGTFLRLFNH